MISASASVWRLTTVRAERWHGQLHTETDRCKYVTVLQCDVIEVDKCMAGAAHRERQVQEQEVPEELRCTRRARSHPLAHDMTWIFSSQQESLGMAAGTMQQTALGMVLSFSPALYSRPIRK
jgi:hypothetical protein